MSDYEEIKSMLTHIETWNPINAKILEGLGKYGPRNISSLAKSIGLPQSSAEFRLKKLMKETNLGVFAHLDWTRLGLMKAFVIAEALPGHWKTLWMSLENLSYLTYLVRCYGRFRGCHAMFSFPPEHKSLLEDYLEQAMRLKVISHFLLFWTTNPCRVNPNFAWFDFKRKGWAFHWKEWIKEISNASEDLPQQLTDPEAYPIMVDERDLVILKELEQNAMCRFKELAKVVGITTASVAYRYHKHIVQRNLIIDYYVGIYPYPYQASEFCTFVIHFENEKALAKFANFLVDKPFMHSYEKVLGENSLITHVYIPKVEFPNFIELLDTFAEMGLIKSFFHVTLILRPFKDNPLPCKLFKNGTWHYNFEEDLERLRKIASK